MLLLLFVPIVFINNKNNYFNIYSDSANIHIWKINLIDRNPESWMKIVGIQWMDEWILCPVEIRIHFLFCLLHPSDSQRFAIQMNTKHTNPILAVVFSLKKEWWKQPRQIWQINYYEWNICVWMDIPKQKKKPQQKQPWETELMSLLIVISFKITHFIISNQQFRQFFVFQKNNVSAFSVETKKLKKMLDNDLITWYINGDSRQNKTIFWC